ncbi:MAG TPA: GatB/YqeY domain-containing protein [Gaiellales bacterium]|nr:GatB/YqeY domain-containing protein [Gaiellales bacterium]
MIEQVKSDLTAAMRAGDRTRVDGLRLVLSALQRAEKAVPAGEFSEADAEAVLRRERKQRLEAAESYTAAGRDDRAAAELADVPLIEAYLPAALSEEELAALVDGAIEETGAASMRDMGRVMGLVTARGEGRVDGAAAAALVRARLGS